MCNGIFQSCFQMATKTQHCISKSNGMLADRAAVDTVTCLLFPIRGANRKIVGQQGNT